MTGKARVKSFADPEYSIKINAKELKTNAVASVVDVLKNNQGGAIDFNVSGRGNLDRVEDSLFKGSAVLKGLVFKWEDRKNPLTLSANVRFSGDTYNVRADRKSVV